MKHIKLILGTLLAFQLAGCSDDLVNKQELPVSGDEISFGAQASGFSSGSRTVYGLPDGEESRFDSYSALTISWIADKDMVRVYSPQASEECQWADYTVKQADGNFYLAKNGDIGVRWGVTSKAHDFYAFYPLNKITADGLEGKSTVTASIPVAQERGELLYFKNDGTQTNENDVDATWKIIAPDMSYCMMAGRGTWVANTEKNVTLTFTPLVSVLDVVINGPAEGQPSMNIVSVSVSSENQGIVGDFEYDYSNKTFKFPGTSVNNKLATVSCVQGTGSGAMPVTLSHGQKLNVKFFLLPRDIKADELSVSVFMEGGYVLTQNLSAEGNSSSGKNDGVLASGKISRVITPNLRTPATNNWMSLIDNNVLFSQLSLPGSKHSFTASAADVTNIATDLMQKFQSLNAIDGNDTQFNAGIRAFDVKVTNNSYVFAGGKTLSFTINQVLTNLSSLLNPVGATATEGAVVCINYVDLGNNVSASDWTSSVISTIESWGKSNRGKLHKLTSSTTMGDMRGKIAVIVNAPVSYTAGTTYCNYISNYSSSVQNLDLITDYKVNDNLPVVLQNLYQVNNPTLSSAVDSNDSYAYESDLGLLPYYITEKVYTSPDYDYNLLARKKKLMQDMLDRIKTGPDKLYINDLGGFCVVRNSDSTGSVSATTYRYNRGWWTVSTSTYYDFRRIQNYSSEWPNNPNNGDEIAMITGSDSEKGNGGNTMLFAQLFNSDATQAFSDMVENGRVPLGIVFMNFAGVSSVSNGTHSYNVQGIRLPGLIMANNFLFELKTASSSSN